MTYGVGELVMIDESEPYVVDAAETAFASILLPRRAILELRPEIGTHLVTATRADSLNALALMQLVRTLARTGPPSQDTADRSIRDAVIALVIGTIETQGVKPCNSRQDGAVHQRARSFVLNHLTEPDLSPERIASGAGISRSSLYRAFASTGGVSRFVQNCRVDKIRSLLADVNERRSITELALVFGFTSVGHFSRVFRDRTGQSPRDFRSGSSATSPAANT